MDESDSVKVSVFMQGCLKHGSTQNLEGCLQGKALKHNIMCTVNGSSVADCDGAVWHTLRKFVFLVLQESNRDILPAHFDDPLGGSFKVFFRHGHSDRGTTVSILSKSMTASEPVVLGILSTLMDV